MMPELKICIRGNDILQFMFLHFRGGLKHTHFLFNPIKMYTLRLVDGSLVKCLMEHSLQDLQPDHYA